MIPQSNSLLSKLLSCPDPSNSEATQNGQVAEGEEIFAEFDKKCIGLETMNG